jgi:hypothetical protein
MKKYTLWFRHNPQARASAVLALLALLAGGFWWSGGLPARELSREQVGAFLAGTLVKPSSGGKVFCVPDVLGTRLREAPAGALVREYVYARCQEYYLTAGRLELGTGASVPVIITARWAGAGYSLIGFRAAADDAGGLEMFPPLIRRRIAAAERLPDPPGPSAQAAAYFRL